MGRGSAPSVAPATPPPSETIVFSSPAPPLPHTSQAAPDRSLEQTWRGRGAQVGQRAGGLHSRSRWSGTGASLEAGLPSPHVSSYLHSSSRVLLGKGAGGWRVGEHPCGEPAGTRERGTEKQALGAWGAPRASSSLLRCHLGVRSRDTGGEKSPVRPIPRSTEAGACPGRTGAPRGGSMRWGSGEGGRRWTWWRSGLHSQQAVPVLPGDIFPAAGSLPGPAPLSRPEPGRQAGVAAVVQGVSSPAAPPQPAPACRPRLIIVQMSCQASGLWWRT